MMNDIFLIMNTYSKFVMIENLSLDIFPQCEKYPKTK